MLFFLVLLSLINKLINKYTTKILKKTVVFETLLTAITVCAVTICCT